MRTTILSLGGSLIVPEQIDIAFLKDFKDLVLRSKDRFIIICGGGRTCRNYQAAAGKVADITDVDSDLIGIAATKLNAEMVRSIFGKLAYHCIVDDPDNPPETDKRIIIGSGFSPGWSSDKAAVILAHKYSAKQIINMSNIDMVYDSDPKSNPTAEPIKEMSWDDFLRLTGEEWIPGKNVPFDPVASKLAEEFGLRVIILNGKNLRNLKECMDGKECKGTTLS